MNERIRVVDGFRCIAVIGVIFFHFLYRFSPPIMAVNYVPYQFGESVMQYGFFGVQLFFVISGFVICRTLEASSNIREFFIRRLIRLWPTLLVCSVITYVFVKIFDRAHFIEFFHVSIWSFVPTLTFTTPDLWNYFLPELNFSYVDGVYWSLFVEVIFYLLSAVIFFRDPKSFLRNWLIFVAITYILRVATSPKLYFLFDEQINFYLSGAYRFHFLLKLNYLAYFSAGIFFFYLYSKRTPAPYLSLIMCFITVLEFYFLGSFVLRLLYSGVIALFAIFIFRGRWLAFLGYPLVAWIGLVSYPLYLLHDNIGIILINALAPWTSSIVSNEFLPFIVTVILIAFSSALFVFVERPAASFLKRFVAVTKATPARS